MRVFVTGANGLVGVNVINRLHREGYQVKALVRDMSRYPLTTPSGVTLVKGDLTDTGSFRDELVGCDCLVHTAAMTDVGYARYSNYKRVNVDATADLMRLSAEAGVKRAIFVSTANSVGYGSVNEPGRESMPMSKMHKKLLYARSKREAEEIVLSMKGRMEVIIVNPGFILGRYASVTGSGRIILMGYRKKILFYPPGGKSFVHVKDVAAAVAAAITGGRDGERYLLTGQNLTYREFFDLLSQITGSNPLMIRVPGPLLLVAALPGMLLRAAGIKSELSVTNMRSLTKNTFYTGQKAESELGIKYSSTESAIEETLEWFMEKGVIAI